MSKTKLPRRTAREEFYEVELGRALGIKPERLRRYPEKTITLIADAFDRGKDAFAAEFHALRHFVKETYGSDALPVLRAAAKLGFPWKKVDPKQIMAELNKQKTSKSVPVTSKKESKKCD